MKNIERLILGVKIASTAKGYRARETKDFDNVELSGLGLSDKDRGLSLGETPAQRASRIEAQKPKIPTYSTKVTTNPAYAPKPYRDPHMAVRDPNRGQPAATTAQVAGGTSTLAANRQNTRTDYYRWKAEQDAAKAQAYAPSVGQAAGQAPTTLPANANYHQAKAHSDAMAARAAAAQAAADKQNAGIAAGQPAPTAVAANEPAQNRFGYGGTHTSPDIRAGAPSALPVNQEVAQNRFGYGGTQSPSTTPTAPKPTSVVAPQITANTQTANVEGVYPQPDILNPDPDQAPEWFASGAPKNPTPSALTSNQKPVQETPVFGEAQLRSTLPPAPPQPTPTPSNAPSADLRTQGEYVAPTNPTALTPTAPLITKDESTNLVIGPATMPNAETPTSIVKNDNIGIPRGQEPDPGGSTLGNEPFNPPLLDPETENVVHKYPAANPLEGVDTNAIPARQGEASQAPNRQQELARSTFATDDLFADDSQNIPINLPDGRSMTLSKPMLSNLSRIIGMPFEPDNPAHVRMLTSMMQQNQNPAFSTVSR